MNQAANRQVLILGALAQPTRLRIVAIVADAGMKGIAAGEIARALHCPASTLSFHLKELSRAEVLEARPRGRYVIYAMQPGVLGELAKFVGRLGGAEAAQAAKTRPARGRRSARKGRAVDRGQLSMFGD
jgi:ArsR family transcriptional regulator, arsenate/arsenite/antimonite-responsive transcriptional repressor